MPKFTTLTPIKFAPDAITPEGTEVDLTEKQAKPLVAAGAIAPAPAVQRTDKKDTAK